jgi:hypothetical protein
MPVLQVEHILGFFDQHAFYINMIADDIGTSIGAQLGGPSEPGERKSGWNLA